MQVSFSVRGVRQRLAQVERERAELLALGEAMCREFRERFPEGPAYLTRYADQTANEYRWRRSSAKRWRGERVHAATLDLTSEPGRALLQTLPDSVRQVWLAYEQRRIDLNLAVAQVNYERRRLRDWLARTAAIGELSQNSAEDPTPLSVVSA